MLYNRNPHYINPMQPAPEQKFELYADELEALAKFAATTGKREFAETMQQLAQYGRAKANLSHGPVRFTFK